MSARDLVVACAAVLSLATVAAQTPQAPVKTTDRISGTWTGDIGLTDDARFPVTFALKFDGTSAISGTVQGPGPAQLKTATFDPKTNALKLELLVSDDGQPAPFVFDGVAVNGVATGRVSGKGQTGTFKIARHAADATAAPQAGPDTSAMFRKGFEEVSAWITKSAALVPADKYTYQPTKTVRTFGQLIAHVADAYDYYCGRAAGKEVQWSDVTEKGKLDKVTLAAKLKQSTDACTAVFNGQGDPSQLLANLAHTSLHYGNVITYLRMLGLTPPSSS
jgi:uncharacterized damage-inducible protein DinB